MSSFTRFVYAPKAYAFIYSRKDGVVHDVSNDIVSGSIQRLVDQPSKATITLKNNNFKYTGKFNPLFFPMDGITVWLQKVAGAPIQQFTGFIDSIPYFQAYPGAITIQATCTLKQYMYTYFDPGLGFMDWITNNGWNVNGQGGTITGIFNAAALVETLGDTGGSGNDGGLGELLRKFLIDIGGANPNSLAIGNIPKKLPEAMIKTYLKRVKESQAAEKALIPALERYFTMEVNQDSAEDIASAIENSVSSRTISGSANITDLKRLVASVEASPLSPKPSGFQVLLAALIMSGLDKNHREQDSSKVNYGSGYFGNPAGGGSEGSAAHAESDGGRITTADPAAQGNEFCRRFQNFFKNSSVGTQTAGASAAQHGGRYGTPVGETDTMPVAQVLAFEYGHDKFYSQILAACNDTKNQGLATTVLNDINSNRNLNDARSVNFSSAQDVVTQSAPNQVTWEGLFNIVPADNPDGGNDENSVPISANGRKDGAAVTIETGTHYTSPSGGGSHSSRWTPKRYSGSDTITVSGFPKPKNTPIKCSEIKYLIFSKANGTNNDGFISVFAGLSIGQIVEVKNKKNGKTCRCVYAGATTIDGAPIALSKYVFDLIGASPNVEFTATSESIPMEPSGTRNAFINSIRAVLGTGPAPAAGDKTSNLNINQDDRDEYEKHYKTANNRLAEYFYIASTYDMHLLKNVKPGSNALLLTSNNAEQVFKFLQDIGVAQRTSGSHWLLTGVGVAQSVANRIWVTFSNGSEAYEITFSANAENPQSGTSVRPTTSNVPEALKKAQIVVEITSGPNFPSPVWNGQTVVLPTDPASDGDGSGSTSHTVNWEELARMNTAAAFTTLTNFPFDLLGSAFLVGEKSLMNDVPVMQGIQQFCQGSMRSFMSLPNGMFAAFYPDRFGVFGRKPYLDIKDLEIVDFNIVLNDEALVTHMYVNGNTIDPLNTSSQNNQLNQVLSVGVITIDDIFTSNKSMNFVYNPTAATGVGDDNKTVDNIDFTNDATPAEYTQYDAGLSQEALKFLQTYGPRPKVENNPLIRSPWFEFVKAYNDFAYNWSATTATNVQLTFMPELMAGGLVRFPEHNVIMYCEAVHHTWSYETGFETTAYLSSPSTEVVKDSKGKIITEEEPVPGMVIFNKV